MAKVSRDSLMTLEAYSKARDELRAQVMAHKKHRTLHLGNHITLIFEDDLTIRYQIQEMLRAEKIFEEAGIQDELDAYNPLIPDGNNWKATMMIEYTDIEQRRIMLSKLIGVEDKVWVQVAGNAMVFAVADEDLERETDTKTSAVHFLRFDLTQAMIASLRQGAALSAGVDHPAYQAKIGALSEPYRASLLNDVAA